MEWTGIEPVTPCLQSLPRPTPKRLSLTMRAFQTVLGLGSDAWDVYLLYGPGVRWDGDLPPRPDFWMHQLEEADRLAPFLDPYVFAERAMTLLTGH
jgi:hypothetical protein